MTKQPEIIWQRAADRVLFARHGLENFADFMMYAGGTRICHKRGRSVVRLELAGRAFYLKRNCQHPAEFWKALSHLRWPRLGARREWQNILAVQAAGIPTVTPVAVSERCLLGIETESFTVTEELYGAEPLDVLWRRDFARPRSPEQITKKRDLLRKLAVLARQFHARGMNHQDFYLNHFFVGQGGQLFLIDLQRVQRRVRKSRRGLIKDLAQLNYSTLVYGGFSKVDRLRFFKEYLNGQMSHDEVKEFLCRIFAKTERIARHDKKHTIRRQRRGELPSV